MTINIKDKPATLVERYISLRNERKQFDERAAAMRKTNYDDEMNQLENTLLDVLNKTGAESIRSKTGTVSKKLFSSVTTADGAEFRRHVIGLEAWDLADWKPNKTAIEELVENGEPLPPGVNRSTTWKIHVNKAKD
jgi:hypothetical protein